MKEFLKSKKNIALAVLSITTIAASVAAGVFYVQLSSAQSEIKDLKSKSQDLQAKLNAETNKNKVNASSSVVTNLDFLEKDKDYLIYYSVKDATINTNPDVTVKTTSIYLYDQSNKKSYLIKELFDTNTYNGIKNYQVTDSGNVQFIDSHYEEIMVISLNDLLKKDFSSLNISAENYITDDFNGKAYIQTIDYGTNSGYPYPDRKSLNYLQTKTEERVASDLIFTNDKFHFSPIGFLENGNIILSGTPFVLYYPSGDFDKDAEDELFVYDISKSKLNKLADISRGGLLNELSPDKKFAIRSFVKNWEYDPIELVRKDNTSIVESIDLTTGKKSQIFTSSTDEIHLMKWLDNTHVMFEAMNGSGVITYKSLDIANGTTKDLFSITIGENDPIIFDYKAVNRYLVKNGKYYSSNLSGLMRIYDINTGKYEEVQLEGNSQYYPIGVWTKR